jgi:hypothetical protein
MDGDGNVSLNNSVHGSGLSGNTGVLSPVSGKAIVRQSAATTPDPEQSASVVSSSSRNALTGQEVTYTFTVPQFDASAAGRVQFTDGGSAIAGCGAATVDTSNGNATCTVTYAHPGAHAVQAGYLGDPLNPPAFSHGLLQETVQPASTTSALSVSPANPVAGQQVTYTMSVDTTSPGQGTATGSVAFSEDGTPIDGCGAKSLDDSGSATCTVTYAHPSQHLIGASYGGDGDRVGSDAASLDVTVQQAPTTTNVYVTDPANGDAVVGQPVTYTASVSSSGSGNPTGTVAFSDGGNAIASCASQQVDPNGDATCTITSMSPRTESISAVYSGGSDYLGSSSKTVSETVDPAPTATAISSSPSSSQYGQQVTFTAVVSVRSPGAGTPSGTVTFTSGDGTSLGSASLKDDGNGHQVASISTDALHAGADQVTAAYGGDANYKGSSQSLTQTVAKAPTAIALQSPSVIKSLVTFKVTTVATLTSTVTGKGIPGQTVTFTVGTKQICTAITDATGTATCESKSNLLAPLLPGTPVTAAFAGTSDYAASEASAKAHLA